MQVAHRGGRVFADRYGTAPGEMRVLPLLTQGKTNRETANRIGPCESKVRIQVSATFRILEVAQPGLGRMWCAGGGQSRCSLDAQHATDVRSNPILVSDTFTDIRQLKPPVEVSH